MESLIHAVPGYRVYEYQLVLNPHEELRDRLMAEKEQFAEKYKTEFARKSRAHVALVTFTQHGMMEGRIINRLRTVAMGYPPFRVDLKDYGSFPSHTVYINVLSKIPVQGLVREIRRESQRLMKMDEEHKPHFIMEPHLTIARKLKPWQYEKGWLEYSHKHFTGRFIAQGMTLLKRPQGELKYQALCRFEFKNLPVTTRQGDLFS